MNASDLGFRVEGTVLHGPAGKWDLQQANGVAKRITGGLHAGKLAVIGGGVLLSVLAAPTVIFSSGCAALTAAYSMSRAVQVVLRTSTGEVEIASFKFNAIHPGDEQARADAIIALIAPFLSK
jgi:hypothetical protein